MSSIGRREGEKEGKERESSFLAASTAVISTECRKETIPRASPRHHDDDDDEHADGSSNSAERLVPQSCAPPPSPRPRFADIVVVVVVVVDSFSLVYAFTHSLALSVSLSLSFSLILSLSHLSPLPPPLKPRARFFNSKPPFEYLINPIPARAHTHAHICFVYLPRTAFAKIKIATSTAILGFNLDTSEMSLIRVRTTAKPRARRRWSTNCRPGMRRGTAAIMRQNSSNPPR